MHRSVPYFLFLFFFVLPSESILFFLATCTYTSAALLKKCKSDRVPIPYEYLFLLWEVFLSIIMSFSCFFFFIIVFLLVSEHLSSYLFLITFFFSIKDLHIHFLSKLLLLFLSFFCTLLSYDECFPSVFLSFFFGACTFFLFVVLSGVCTYSTRRAVNEAGGGEGRPPDDFYEWYTSINFSIYTGIHLLTCSLCVDR